MEAAVTADTLLADVGYEVPNDNDVPVTVDQVHNMGTSVPLNLATSGFQAWSTVNSESLENTIIDLLPDPEPRDSTTSWFDTPRKGCLKKEQPLAIKAAVSETMYKEGYFRPFHVYKKQMGKTWPPPKLCKHNEGEIIRKKLKRAAIFSHQDHAHFLWIRQCEGGCEKIAKKKQGAAAADSKALAGFLQYNVFEGGRVIVNAIEVEVEGDEKVKRLLLFWLYLKLYVILKKDVDLVTIQIWGVDIDLVKSDSPSTVPQLPTLYEEGSWEKATVDLKTLQARAKQATQAAKKADPSQKSAAKKKAKDARQTLQIKQQDQLRIMTESKDTAVKEKVKTMVAAKQEELGKKITAFTNDIAQILGYTCHDSSYDKKSAGCRRKSIQECKDATGCTPRGDAAKQAVQSIKDVQTQMSREPFQTIMTTELEVKANAEIDSKISIATVYRTVKLFEEAGILVKHDFKAGKARYEINDDHNHLIDINSGEIVEFVDKDIEKLQYEVAKKLGYKLVDHKLELYGSKIKK